MQHLKHSCRLCLACSVSSVTQSNGKCIPRHLSSSPLLSVATADAELATDTQSCMSVKQSHTPSNCIHNHKVPMLTGYSTACTCKGTHVHEKLCSLHPHPSTLAASNQPAAGAATPTHTYKPLDPREVLAKSKLQPLKQDTSKHLAQRASILPIGDLHSTGKVTKCCTTSAQA